MQANTNLDVKCEIGNYRNPETNGCSPCPAGGDDCVNDKDIVLCPVGKWQVVTPGRPSTCADAIPAGYIPF